MATAMLSDEPAPATNLEPPAQPENLRSTDGGVETEIFFVNGTETEVAYYWIDQDGFDHYYGRAAPGSGACQHTLEDQSFCPILLPTPKSVGGEHH